MAGPRCIKSQALLSFVVLLPPIAGKALREMWRGENALVPHHALTQAQLELDLLRP